jgi:hypothetical protein
MVSIINCPQVLPRDSHLMPWRIWTGVAKFRGSEWKSGD